MFLSFGHLGVQLNELEDYLKHVDLMPFARDVVAFPVPKRSNLQIPNPASAEVQSREEHIPEHLPLMFPSAEGRLTLNAPIATKVVCFSHLLKCLRSLCGKQCGPRSDCSGSTLFGSILNSSVMLGNYLQQMTSAGGNFRCIFFLAL